MNILGSPPCYWVSGPWAEVSDLCVIINNIRIQFMPTNKKNQPRNSKAKFWICAFSPNPNGCFLFFIFRIYMNIFVLLKMLESSFSFWWPWKQDIDVFW
jgi:hypothetical protein